MAAAAIQRLLPEISVSHLVRRWKGERMVVVGKNGQQVRVGGTGSHPQSTRLNN